MVGGNGKWRWKMGVVVGGWSMGCIASEADCDCLENDIAGNELKFNTFT